MKPGACFGAVSASVFLIHSIGARAIDESVNEISTRKILQWRSDIHRTGYEDVTLAFDETAPSLLVRHDGLNKGIHTAAKSSPIVLDDGTFIQAGDAGIIYRLRLDGTVVWAAAQQGFSAVGYHSTPCVVYRGGEGEDDLPDLVIIGSYDGVLSAFDLATGQIIWENTEETGQHIGASPACTAEAVYISIEFSKPKWAGGLCKVDIADGKAVWCSYTMGSHSHSSPAVDFDLNIVVAGANDGKLHVFQESDGEKLAEYSMGETDDDDSSIKGAILLWKGVAIFGSWAGQVHAVDLNDINKEVASSEGTRSLKTEAAKHWGFHVSVDNDAKVMSAAAIDPETEKIYIGAHDSIVRCIDFHSGDVLWNYKTKSYVLSSPVVLKNAVVIGSSDGHIYALNKNDGSLLWKFIKSRTGKVTSSIGISADGSTLMFASDSYSFTKENNCKGKPGALHIVGREKGSKKVHGVNENREEV